MRVARLGAVSILVLLLIILAATMLSSYQVEIFTLVVAYTIASLAQNLLAGYADVPSLGNVAFLAISAYTTAWLVTLVHLSQGVAIVVGVVAAGLLGLVIGLPALRISGMHLAVVTVALVFAGQELMTQWDTAHNAASVSIAPPDWLQGKGLFLAACLLAALAYLLVWNLLATRSGRAIVALSDNPRAAEASGIPVMRYRLTVFVISGVLTGVAGIVYLYYLQTVTPGAFSLNLSLAFLTMMIVGGTGSLGGSLVGALVIGLLPQLLSMVPTQVGQLAVKDASYAVYSLLLLIMLRFFPDGIWNAVEGLVGRMREAQGAVE